MSQHDRNPGKAQVLPETVDRAKQKNVRIRRGQPMRFFKKKPLVDYTLAGIYSREIECILQDLYEDFNAPQEEQQYVREIYEERISLVRKVCQVHRDATEAILGRDYYTKPEAIRDLVVLAKRILFSPDESFRELWRQRISK